MEMTNDQGEVSIFKYSTLPDASTHIRLLKVTSAEDGGIVECTISYFSIEFAPPYNAISYTWGDATATSIITLNGQKVTVRKNCDNVLRQAFWNVQSQYVWIDALCINQDDIPEKNVQVAMMGRIYKSVQRVLACVGSHDDDSEYLMQVLRDNEHFYTSVWKELEKIDWMDEWVYSQEPPYHLGWAICRWLLQYPSSRLFQAHDRFFERSYFSRVWIVQELFMADDAVVCCGTDSVPYHSLAGHVWMVKHIERSGRYDLPATIGIYGSHRKLGTLAHIILQRARQHQGRGEHARIVDDNNSMIMLGSRTSSQLMPFDRCIIRTCHFLSQDPRDKVYAVLAMVDWQSQNPIFPNYHKSTFDLALGIVETYVGSADFTDLKDWVMLLVTTLRLDEMDSHVKTRLDTLSSNDTTLSSLDISPDKSAARTRLQVCIEAYPLMLRAMGSDNIKNGFYVDGGSNRTGPNMIGPLLDFGGVREGDCVIQFDDIDGRCLVVVREQFDGSYALLGYTAFEVARVLHSQPKPMLLQVSFDTEDLIMYAILQAKLEHLAEEREHDLAVCELRKLMSGRRFCRYEGSSYAVRATEDHTLK